MPQESAPITIDDLYQLGWLEDPRFSPDGQLIAFVCVTVDRAMDRYRRAIWLASVDGSPLRRLTSGTRADTQPRWSPDGRQIAFVSTRDGDKPQIYLMRVAGGEARQITRMPWGATDPAWSPDGTHLAFLARIHADERAREDLPEPEPADEWEKQQLVARRAHDEALRVDPRVITRLPYRSGTTFFDQRRPHVYLVDLPASDEDEPGRPRRLTDGDLQFSAPAWMPDGMSILTTATRDPDSDTLFSLYDALRVPVLPEERAPAVRLTAPGFSYYDPIPAPDGYSIAVRRRPDDRPMSAGFRIAVLPASGGEPRDLTAGSDLNAEQHRWAPDGAGVLFTAGWHGDTPVYQVSTTPEPSWNAVVTGNGRTVAEFDVAPDGRLAFVAGDATNPCDLFLRHGDGSEVRLTSINAKWLNQRWIAPLEEIAFSAPDGRTVQGWLLRPPDFDPAHAYPLVVHIHGGPHLMWGPGQRSMWHEWQTTAARGYLVFFCNPRGSDGYGDWWRDGVRSSWGTSDTPDIHAGIDAVAAHVKVDPQRIAVTGGSYGGFMTAWLLAHSSRFACGVAARGVYNLLSEHSTSDAHELIESEFEGYPWERQELLWQHSPLAHAHRITTPLLILHSEQDYRVPISEAEQLFSILRRRKQIVEFVRYPREGHELTRVGEPRHRADHMRRTIEWIDRFCKF